MKSSFKPGLVSVIIPAFNEEFYIGQAISSVLSQSYNNFEIIVVVDGATDNTLSIAESFVDPRIVVLQQPNRGVSAARNLGIAASSGEYIAFLDGDDYWHNLKLEKHVLHLTKNPRVGVSFSYSYFIDPSGNIQKVVQLSKIRDVGLDHQFICNSIGNGSTAVVRRRTLFDLNKRSDVFHVSFCNAEDYFLWIDILRNTSWLLEGIPYLLVYYRVYDGSQSSHWLRHYRYQLRVGRLLNKSGFNASQELKRRRDGSFHFFLARCAVLRSDYLQAGGFIRRALKKELISLDAVALGILLVAGASKFLPTAIFNIVKESSFSLYRGYQRLIISRDRLRHRFAQARISR